VPVGLDTRDNIAEPFDPLLPRLTHHLFLGEQLPAHMLSDQHTAANEQDRWLRHDLPEIREPVANPIKGRCAEEHADVAGDPGQNQCRRSKMLEEDVERCREERRMLRLQAK
jgi:hypothetical protein